MELNFTELDNLHGKNTNNNNYDYLINNNSEKYWEQTTEHNKEQTKRKKVTFGDILDNMNLSVNKSGVLQFIAPKAQAQYEENTYQESHQNHNYYANNTNNNNNNNNNFQQIKKQNPNDAPIDPSVKHSFIYNKYFKDYQSKVHEEPVIRVPKTMEEYRQMLLEDRLKKIEHQKRISEIKSTKLMFTTNQFAPTNGQNIVTNRNGLRRMNFS